MHKVKLNDYCEFPHTLDMFPYTREGLASVEKDESMQPTKALEESLNADSDASNEDAKKKNKKGKGKKDATDPTADTEKKGDTIHYEIRPKEYYEYELTGILVHRGVADSGHYYSYIKVPAVSDDLVLTFGCL